VVTAVVLFVFFGGITAGLRWYFSRREHDREGGEEKPAGAPTAPPAPVPETAGAPPADPANA
jgi:hypothetical protein